MTGHGNYYSRHNEIKKNKTIKILTSWVYTLVLACFLLLLLSIVSLKRKKKTSEKRLGKEKAKEGLFYLESYNAPVKTQALINKQVSVPFTEQLLQSPSLRGKYTLKQLWALIAYACSVVKKQK